MSWRQTFKAQTTKDRLRPRYVLIIAEQTVESNMNPLTTSATNIQVDDIWSFTADEYIDEQLFLYDQDGWEWIALGYIDPDTGATDILTDCTRAQQGTQARQYNQQAMILLPKLILSTHEIDDDNVTLVIKPYMLMPSGHNTTLNVQEGRTTATGVTVEVMDTDGWFTTSLRGFPVNGKRAVILGGYDGMDFADYEILFTGSTRDLRWRAGKYQLTIEADWERLNRSRFGQIEDFASTLNEPTGVLVGDTTITIDSPVPVSALYAYDNGTTYRTTDAGGYAGIYWKVDSELMLDNYVGGSSFPILDVVRGQLGTSAATHADEAEVDTMYSIQANPIDILLYLLISRDYNYPRQGDYDAHLGALDDEGLGCGYQVSDIDVDSFTDIRDLWFPNDVWRCDFAERVKVRQYIENHILKVINGNLYVNRSGKLALAIINPPIPGADNVTFTEADIVGAPEISIKNETIINEVRVNYDWDAFTEEFSSGLVDIDATSQTTYDRDGTITLEAKGLDTNYAGASLAATYATRKMRNFKNPPLVTSIEVLFNKGAAVEPGDVVLVDHSNIPDPNMGRTSLNTYMGVTGKRFNWVEGTVQLDLINTNYLVEGRFGLFAPDSVSDYTSATDEEKARYGFFCDNTTNKMTNGDEGYLFI